jgi:hypothetical protein
MNGQLRPVGYEELRRRYAVSALPHFCTSFIAPRGRRRTHADTQQTTEVYPDAYAPGEADTEHLEFALKHEGVNLELLSAVFAGMDPGPLTAWIRDRPFSVYAHRVWFLYEFLTDRRLSTCRTDG